MLRCDRCDISEDYTKENGTPVQVFMDDTGSTICEYCAGFNRSTNPQILDAYKQMEYEDTNTKTMVNGSHE